jgi:hypothetical protein
MQRHTDKTTEIVSWRTEYRLRVLTSVLHIKGQKVKGESGINRTSKSVLFKSNKMKWAEQAVGMQE